MTLPTPTIDEVPRGRAAMWWVIASEIVIFGGLIVSYLLYRTRFPEWAEQTEHTSTPLGALNTFVLLTSSFTVVLAHQAAVQKQVQRACKLLWVTVGMGGMFLVVKSIEYTNEITHGRTIGSHLFWSFYFVMTGLHAAHVIAGMTAMSVVASQIRGGKNLHRVEMAGLYWHFVDVIWIFLFPLLYIAK
jgi:heme/copper-type cytochrome/quinol oxidase subunit 3